MHRDSLTTLLARLRDELDAADSVSDESRELLRQVAVDIDRVLQDSGSAAEPHRIEYQQRLAQLVSHFELSHPSVAAAVRAVMDTLGRAGV